MADSVPYENSAALSAIIYDLDGKNVPKGSTMESVAENPSLSLNHQNEIEQILAANGLEDAKILDTSWSHVDGSGNPQYGTMNAMVVQVGDDIYVVYRGTGDGNWKYNADSAFGDVPSDMQEWALDYFDYAVENYVDEDANLYVTGHSQGGNNAMYVTIASEYADQIDHCVSIDGPGFSEDVIDSITNERGHSFMDQQTDKIYAIYGDNDYVHRLGEVHITPKGHEIVVPTDSGNMEEYHDIFSHMTDGKINIQYGENGEIISVPDGAVSEMVAKVNENMLKYLSEEERHECAKAVMAVVEVMIGDKDPSHLLDPGAFAELLDSGLPMLLYTVIQDPAGLSALLLGEDAELTQWIEEHSLVASIVLSVVSIAILRSKNLMLIEAVLRLADYVIGIVEKARDIAENIKQFITETFQMIKEAFQKLEEYLRGITPGGRYVDDNPYFKADPEKLKNYATRLDRVNQRLVQLDKDLDSLYWQVGLVDLGEIASANLITSYSTNLLLAKSFLNKAAEKLEAAERKAKGYMGG